MAIDIETLALAKQFAKAYADSSVEGLTGGVSWKGAVPYYDDLPSSPSKGDAYTIVYQGSSGTTPDGRMFVWGDYEGTTQWIPYGVDTSQLQKKLIAGIGAQITSDTLNVLGVKPITEEPIGDNLGGDVKFVFLDHDPTTKYNGYFYVIY